MTMLLPLVLLKSLYVGDFVCGAKDMNSAFSLSKEIELCLKSGGFNIRKWNSNSASRLQSLKQDSAFSGDFATNSKECNQEEDESFSKSVFKQGTETEQKVLGMLWNPNQDELSYDLTKILEGVEVQPATRILTLSTATRFFDPFGVNISSYFTLSKTVQGSKGLGRVSGSRTQPRVVANFVRPKTSWKSVF